MTAAATTEGAEGAGKEQGQEEGEDRLKIEDRRRNPEEAAAAAAAVGGGSISSSSSRRQEQGAGGVRRQETFNRMIRYLPIQRKISRRRSSSKLQISTLCHLVGPP